MRGVATGLTGMANKNLAARGSIGRRGKAESLEQKEVPLQVKMPEKIRYPFALLSAHWGESIRTVALHGLRATGIEESELGDRRGRRRNGSGGGDGTQ